MNSSRGVANGCYGQSDPMKTMYVMRRAVDFGGMCEACLQCPGWVADDGLLTSRRTTSNQMST
jgi:hypothetical protein